MTWGVYDFEFWDFEGVDVVKVFSEVFFGCVEFCVWKKVHSAGVVPVVVGEDNDIDYCWREF